ncbi:MAG: hypothetical protein A3C85_04525 [Candidatus Doudnabacteria bacterium RIFCSPHIGHO2_02_FULL_48_21]|uniref:RNA-binding protein n=1 Tax=Candidatus Doudnabacteria bacterium RIFCSPLOWO2_02_FULL_48_13 TaxID=1817845 RepID=A0A1F5QD66_9BACT|nr:MAG: hypothetical protein A3K05_00540 [Candidatus Doudnabacteria bacterium RIFCSPHIGHO2_01_48_18]OGE79678.1 MAG: hypothetical protein A2668_01110 [Candidatus Doudnabacteria bacterium RIFCSPHIGHO2_01_FULL_48_180]OGE91479.1 MAG: hypothetical protein A3F44_01310 [Candidatus Doudnabacteria bacterium RIFCSPHIGHO2_12_FULL_47_25]OGE93093.1 MAG: hypothetical protein A3C85_04525 [Candidatus Doudnabacteria bacterium RIFCSPHIGHO2_02_FULL_48_21]OGE98101.1 MAG: hypothetical protein A3A83_02490 [Candidatu
MRSLSNILRDKFSRKDDLSKQIEIVKVFDLYRAELQKLSLEKDATAVSLKSKTLLVQLTNSVVASELRLREMNMVAKVNANMGKDVIKRVVYRF